MASSTGLPNTDRANLIATVMVGIVVVVACAKLYQSFLVDPSVRWGSLNHDRNAHYLTAIQLATDIRTVNIRAFFFDVLRIRTWPPLHPIVIGGFATLFGTDYRLAVLPNVILFGLGAIFVYKLAVVLAPRQSVGPGLAALGFYLSSPSHRVYATDFMLETMGTTFSMASLFYYVKYRQSEHSIKLLAVSLTLLFFTKYNYWLLVVIALILTEGWQRRRDLFELPWGPITTTVREWLSIQWKIPLNYLLLFFLMVLLGTIGNDYWHFLPLEDSGGARKHENISHLAFVALLVRIATQYRSEGSWLWLRLPVPIQKLCIWHLLPIAFWFALPKRLAYFLWYIGPNNGPNTHDRTLLTSLEFYWSNASQYYYAVAWLLPLSVLFASLMYFPWKGLDRSLLILLVFVVISLLLTLNHGNQKARFMHTWLPSVWVLSGLGFGIVADEISSVLSRARKFSARGISLGSLIVASSWLGWCLTHVDAGNSPESGNFPAISSLPVAEGYLPWLNSNKSVAIIGTLPIEYFAAWTHIHRYPNYSRPFTTSDMRWFDVSEEVNRTRFNDWLSENHPDRIVLVDVLEGSQIGFPDFENYRQFRGLLADRPDYRKTKVQNLESQQCQVSLWELATTSQ